MYNDVGKCNRGSEGWSIGAPVPLFKEFLHLSIPSKPRLLLKTGIHPPKTKYCTSARMDTDTILLGQPTVVIVFASNVIAALVFASNVLADSAISSLSNV